MAVIRFTSSILSRATAAVSTAGSLCEIAAVGTAVWAICFPEQAADKWVRFEHYLEEARADLKAMAASNEVIAGNTARTAKSTAETSQNTGIVAGYVADMASMERGLEVYAYSGVNEGEPTRGNFDINIGHFSTTPLNNFEYSVLDENRATLGSRRIHQLVQHSNAEAKFSFVADASYPTRPRYTTWVCASGDIAKTGTRAYFTVELEGYKDEDNFILYTVVRQEQGIEPSETCRVVAGN